MKNIALFNPVPIDTHAIIDEIVPMKLAVVGSRNFNDYALLRSTLDNIKHDITMIISGGAIGADKLAARYATDNNIPLKEFLPNYERYGRFRAPKERNTLIVEGCDQLIAFRDLKSKTGGTLDTINKATKLGKKVHVVEI